MTKCEWEIYRLELAFLNPAENRWQMFQETAQPPDSPDPGSGIAEDAKLQPTAEAIYRRQAQGLLKSFRDALEANVPLLKDEEQYTVPQLTDNGDTEIDIARLVHQLRQLCDTNGLEQGSPCSDNFIKDAVAQTTATLQSQGLDLSKFEPLFGKIQQPRNGLDSLVRLRSQTARDLISSLFLDKSWDIFGRISYPEQPADKKVSAAKLPTFSYVLDYPGCEAVATSAGGDRALGYAVRIEEDKLGIIQAGELVSYYSVCKDIPKEERLWYCFYGHLVDALHAGLAGSKSSFPPKTRVYIQCVPLRICGYDHFLQVYFKPTIPDGKSAPTAKDIPKLQLRIVKDGDTTSATTILKECLRELLVQMHIGAFQHHVALELLSWARTINASETAEIFCRHAPTLVRLDWMRIENGRYYAYRKGHNQIFETWGEAPLPQSDERAAFLGCHLAVIKNVSISITAFVPWETSFDGPLAPLFKGTGQQRLEEQLDWLCRRVASRNPVMLLLGKI